MPALLQPSQGEEGKARAPGATRAASPPPEMPRGGMEAAPPPSVWGKLQGRINCNTPVPSFARKEKHLKVILRTRRAAAVPQPATTPTEQHEERKELKCCVGRALPESA